MKEINYDEMTTEQQRDFWQTFVEGLSATLHQYAKLSRISRNKVRELEAKVKELEEAQGK